MHQFAVVNQGSRARPGSGRPWHAAASPGETAPGETAGGGAMSGAGSGLVGLAEIRAAARGLERVAVRTPLIPVVGVEPPLLVKPESLQPTGSFKLRGAYTAIMASEQAAHGRSEERRAGKG